jgi:hypothetical protein
MGNQNPKPKTQNANPKPKTQNPKPKPPTPLSLVYALSIPIELKSLLMGKKKSGLRRF